MWGAVKVHHTLDPRPSRHLSPRSSRAGMGELLGCIFHPRISLFSPSLPGSSRLRMTAQRAEPTAEPAEPWQCLFIAHTGEVA